MITTLIAFVKKFLKERKEKRKAEIEAQAVKMLEKRTRVIAWAVEKAVIKVEAINIEAGNLLSSKAKKDMGIILALDDCIKQSVYDVSHSELGDSIDDFIITNKKVNAREKDLNTAIVAPQKATINNIINQEED